MASAASGRRRTGLAAATLLVLAGCDEGPDKRACRDSTTAYVMAQNMLQQRYQEKAPYFPPRTEISVTFAEGCVHTILGHFIVQDAAGQIARQDYTLVMRYTGQNYWELQSVELQ